MDKRYAPRPIAGWYWAAAAAALLFMLISCAIFAMHVYTDPATLPLDQRAMFEAEPKWVTAVLGVASIVGAVGTVTLLLRRRAAVQLLLVSLVAIIAWGVGIFATPRLRDILSTTEIAVVAATVAITWTIYWFARHSGQRGWLR